MCSTEGAARVEVYDVAIPAWTLRARQELEWGLELGLEPELMLELSALCASATTNCLHASTEPAGGGCGRGTGGVDQTLNPRVAALKSSKTMALTDLARSLKEAGVPVRCLPCGRAASRGAERERRGQHRSATANAQVFVNRTRASGGRALTRALRDARRLPSTRWCPYSHVHVRRESLGFVHRSRTIFCRPRAKPYCNDSQLHYHDDDAGLTGALRCQQRHLAPCHTSQWQSCGL